MGRPLRIAHLAFSALPASVGGLEVVVDQLMRHQQALGHDVTLVTRWKQWRALRRAEFPYRALPLPPRPPAPAYSFQSVGSRWPVAATIRWHQWRERFDLWHIHWLYPTAWMAHDALAGSDTPMVVTPHGADLNVDVETGYGFRQFPENEVRVREIAPRVQTFTAISRSIEERLLDLGVEPSRIVPIPNGVDADRIRAARGKREATRARLGVRSDTSVIISVGRNEPRKGFQFIPETLSRLLYEGRDVRWIIVGAGTDKLRPSLEKEGVDHRVQLLPPIRNAEGSSQFPPNDLAELYAAADVFAFPSLNEGLPLVAIEAMAAGTPLVGNNVPGIRDVIADGVDGLLCRARDPGAMARSIARVFDDPDLADRLRQGGYEKAAAHDWSRIAARYSHVYEAVAEGRR